MDKFLIPIGTAKDENAETVDGTLSLLDMDPGGTAPDDDLYVLEILTPEGESLYFNRTTGSILVKTIEEILGRYDAVGDEELAAMEKVYNAVKGMDAEGFDRLFNWISQRLKDDEKRANTATA